MPQADAAGCGPPVFDAGLQRAHIADLNHIGENAVEFLGDDRLGTQPRQRRLLTHQDDHAGFTRGLPAALLVAEAHTNDIGRREQGCFMEALGLPEFIDWEH